MKKLLVILLPLAVNLGAYAVMDTKALADKANAYITMEQGHMSKWFDNAEKSHAAKMELKKKHINEKMNVVKSNIAKLSKGVPADQYLQEELQEMIALHKKQMGEWKTFHKIQDEAMRSLGQKEEAELAAFEQKYQK